MPGAPAAAQAYCPTRAGQSSLAAPASPSLLWSVKLPGDPEIDDLLIVSPAGRLFVRVDTNKNDSVWIPKRLVAVEQGNVLFSVDFDGSILGVPVLMADGTMRVLIGHKSSDCTLIKLSLDGIILSEVGLPFEAGGNPVVSSDGSLYFAVDDFKGPVQVLSLTPDGATRWLSEPLGKHYQGLALGRDGRLLVTSTLDSTPGSTPVALSALNPDGSLAWQTTLAEDANLYHGPVVGPDGAIHALLSISGQASLMIMEPTGALRRQIELKATIGSGPSGLWVGLDGTSYVRAGTSLMALDPQGDERWRRQLEQGLVVGVTIDRDGTVLASDGKSVIRALEPGTGGELWATTQISQDPSIFFASGVPTLGDGALYFVTYDGTLHGFGAPEKLEKFSTYTRSRPRRWPRGSATPGVGHGGAIPVVVSHLIDQKTSRGLWPLREPRSRKEPLTARGRTACTLHFITPFDFPARLLRGVGDVSHDQQGEALLVGQGYGAPGARLADLTSAASSVRRCSRARWRRLFMASRVRPSREATSGPVSSCTSRRSTTSRSSGSRRAIA